MPANEPDVRPNGTSPQVVHGDSLRGPKDGGPDAGSRGPGDLFGGATIPGNSDAPLADWREQLRKRVREIRARKHTGAIHDEVVADVEEVDEIVAQAMRRAEELKAELRDRAQQQDEDSDVPMPPASVRKGVLETPPQEPEIRMSELPRIEATPLGTSSAAHEPEKPAVEKPPVSGDPVTPRPTVSEPIPAPPENRPADVYLVGEYHGAGQRTPRQDPESGTRPVEKPSAADRKIASEEIPPPVESEVRTDAKRRQPSLLDELEIPARTRATTTERSDPTPTEPRRPKMTPSWNRPQAPSPPEPPPASEARQEHTTAPTPGILERTSTEPPSAAPPPVDSPLEWDQAEGEDPASILGEQAATFDPTAPLSDRVAAAVFDGLVLVVLGLLLVVSGARAAATSWQTFVQAAPLSLGVAWLLFAASYGVFFVGTCGQTLGKMVMRVRVIGTEKFRVGYRRAAVRGLLYALTAIPAGIGLIPAIRDREHRAVHDRFSQTRVVKA